MIRVGDRVRFSSEEPHLEPIDGRGAVTYADGKEIRFREGAIELVLPNDGSVILLCWAPACGEDAVRFTQSGRALCAGCSVGHAGPLLDVRPDVTALVSCACGESLDAGHAEGLLVHGVTPSVACEYRRCLNCSSSRPFMRDEIRNRPVVPFLDGSPLLRHFPHEWATVLDAVFAVFPGEGVELRRGDVVVARSYRLVGGNCDEYGWRIAPPEKET